MSKPSNIDCAYTVTGGPVPHAARDVIERNRDFFASKGIPFEVVEFKPRTQAAKESNVIRLCRAAEKPRQLYMDWDLLVIELPEFDPAKPAFAHIDGKFRRDIFYFYNGDCDGMFKAFLASHPAERFSPDYPGVFGHLHRMQKFFKDANRIDPTTYKHYNLGLKGFVKNGVVHK